MMAHMGAEGSAPKNVEEHSVLKRTQIQGASQTRNGLVNGVD